MVEAGETAVVHLVARGVEDGEPGAVFETTDVDVAMRAGTYEAHRDYRPLEFEVGGGGVPPAIDEAVRKLVPGEERTVVAEAAEAFGERRQDKVVDIDRSILEEDSDVDAEPGELVADQTGAVGWITAVDDRTVTVDFNHEFAGEPVAFEVRLLEVRDTDEDE